MTPTRSPGVMMASRPGVTAALDRAAPVALLALPLFLLHGRGIADALVVAVAVLFLARSAAARDWAWLRRGWVAVAAAWWGWLVLCSALAGPASLAQALGVARFLLFVAALEHWALRDPWVRRWLLRLVQAAAAYIALQCLVQFAAGRNLFGYPRGADGELTGPYENPRAAPPLSRLLFPALLPPVARLLDRGWWRLAGAALTLGAVGVIVLIGQRMPLLLTLLGLLATVLLLPRLRVVALSALVAVGLLLAAASVVSPPAFARLVIKFSAQMASFPDSHYGQIAARAVAIARAHPVLGRGFDGFRTGCADPAYFQGWDGGEGGGAGVCVQHTHNFYLQAAVEGGLPGLLLFSALALAWLRALGRGLGRGLGQEADPLRAGLFVAALLHLWPVASTSAFTSMPLSGWFFLLLGLGLAEAGAYMQRPRPNPPRIACPTSSSP